MTHIPGEVQPLTVKLGCRPVPGAQLGKGQFPEHSLEDARGSEAVLLPALLRLLFPYVKNVIVPKSGFRPPFGPQRLLKEALTRRPSPAPSR